MRRSLGIYLLVALLVSVPVAFLFGADFRGTEFRSALEDEFCKETIGEMPNRVPQRLFVEITDEWNRTLHGETMLVVESSLDDALAAFTFSDRLFPRFEGVDQTEPVDVDHTMRLVVVLGPTLDLMGLTGIHCSNHVFVAYTSNQQGLTLRFIHELGHFFGLSHEWGDATYMGYLWCLGTHAERFNDRQLDILDIWNRPGSTEYQAHWEREQPGRCPWHLQTVSGFPLLVLYLVVVAAVAGILVFVFINQRKKRDEG